MGKWAARPTGFSDPQRVGWSFVSLEFLSMLEVGNLKLDRKRFDVGRHRRMRDEGSIAPLTPGAFALNSVCRIEWDS
jgi:hypothetical protein